MKKYTLVLIALAIGLSSCSKKKGSDSKDANGNCTESFVSDNNRVNYDIEDLRAKVKSKYSTEQDKLDLLNKVVNSCQLFKSRHSGVSCRAYNLNTGNVQEFNSADLISQCDTIQAQLNSINSKNNSYCSAQVINAHNNLISEFNDFSSVFNSKTATEAQKQDSVTKTSLVCKQFLAIFPDQMCRALNQNNGTEKWIKSSEIALVCEPIYNLEKTMVNTAPKEIEVQTSPQHLSVLPQKSADEFGNCTPEFQIETKEMHSEISYSYKKTALINEKIKSAITLEETEQLRRELTDEQGLIVSKCDNFEAKWGEVSCVYNYTDGTDSAVINYSNIELNCKKLRFQNY